MWRIFQFLTKYGNIFLFILLETLSLFLVVRYNQKQKLVFNVFALEASSNLHLAKSKGKNYFDLQEQRDQLKSQNEELMKLLRRTMDELEYIKNCNPEISSIFIDEDSLLRPSERFEFIPARAINNSTHKNYNYITLDKGQKDGIMQGMGVVSPNGVAGMVIGSSKNYSIVLSVLNKKFRLSARVLNNRNVGSISWNGKNASNAQLEFVPQTSPLKEGDTIITSGFSSVFPPDILVGVVDNFNNDNHDGFYDIHVKLATDFNQLDHVYAVKDNSLEVLDSLNNQFALP